MTKKNFWESVLYEGNLPILPGTEGVAVPSGTTAQRPPVPINGTIRYNLDSSRIEGYESGDWAALSGDPKFVDTLDDLRALESRPAYVFVAGNMTPGDNQAGVYRWVQGSVAPDDGFNVIAPSVLPNGRWFRINFPSEADAQPASPTLTSISPLGTVANRALYTTGTNTWAETPLTAFARTILDDASAAEVRTTISALDRTGDSMTGPLTLAADPVSNLQAATKQYVDDQVISAGSGTVVSVGAVAPASGFTISGGPITTSGNLTFTLTDDLAALEGINTIGGVERVSSNTWGTYPLTAAGKAVLAGVDAAAQRTVLGLGTIATQNAISVTISGGTISGIADLAIADGGTGASNPTAARANLGLVIGTDVQAWDAELTALAGLTSAADQIPYFTGSGTAGLIPSTTYGRSLLNLADSSALVSALSLGTMSTQNANAVSISGGTATLSGLTMTGNISVMKASPYLFLNASASGQAARISALTNGSTRWEFGKSGDPESGGNVGSKFVIKRFDDSGVFLDDVLSIERSNGMSTFTREVTMLNNFFITSTFPQIMLTDTDSPANSRIFRWYVDSAGIVLQALNDALNIGSHAYIVRTTAGPNVVQHEWYITQTNPQLVMSIWPSGVVTMNRGLRLDPMNVGLWSRAQLQAHYFLDNTGAAAFGWNYSGGGGELDLFVNRDGGPTGGFSVYDFPNSTGNPALILELRGSDRSMLSGGGRIVKFAQPTTDYSITSSDHYVQYNGGGGHTLTLPAPGSCRYGQMVVVKAMNPCTVTTPAGLIFVNMNSAPTRLCLVAGESITLITDTGNWIVMS